jgi:arginyl-tRNA synthetase
MESQSEKIYSILKKIASEMGAETADFRVERPKDLRHGDFASNIAMSIPRSKYKVLGVTNPFELAEKIVSKLNTKYLINNTDFDRLEIAKPGFINFYLSKQYLRDQVEKIIQEGTSYGSLILGNGRNVSVEFVSANPTGPLHIGNARGGPLGDTIANVLTKAGYSVVREYLHNDVGGQVERLGESIYFTLHPDQIQKNYEIQYQGEYIKELAEKIEESLAQDDGLSQEEFIEKAGKTAVELMLTEILKDCEDMGIKFNKVRKESDLRKVVPEVLPKIKEYLKEKDGALWFAPNDEFLKDRETVVKKSDGQFTYFASDIAYHNEKMSKNDLVIDILGANHSGHEPRIRAVVKALGFDPNNLKVILYQWIRLKRGEEIIKMSKRAGSFVTAREVLDEVGKDAFRFFLLTPRTQTHMDFDLELAKKKSSENPVFYVQYAYTRIASIFSKSQKPNTKNQESGKVDLSFLSTPEETSLIRCIITFPFLIEEIAMSLEVNALVNYSLELANLFHKFYEVNQVISKDKKLTEARLALLKATQITLKNTLDLLGVSTPEKM